PVEALLQRHDRLVHHRERDPATALLANDRPVVRAVGREAAADEAAVRVAEFQRDRPHTDRPALRAVAIAETVTPPLDLLRELVDAIDATRRVHPPRVGIEALIDEELAPGRRAISVQALVASHLLLG